MCVAGMSEFVCVACGAVLARGHEKGLFGTETALRNAEGGFSDPPEVPEVCGCERKIGFF